METRLLRLKENDTETLGRILVFDGLYKAFECVTLELPDRENKTSISRIPAGIYNCKARVSIKYGWHFIVEDVDKRSFILLHYGNYFTNTKGCILLGNDFADINKDGHLDITSSKQTMENFVKIMPQEFELTIIDV